MFIYYQVVGLRGRTLVELRELWTREYVDERCRTSQWTWHVWCRPLPGQFREDAEVFTVRALTPSEHDGRNWLQGRGQESWCYYHEVPADDESILAGDSGGYARLELKKKGELPEWPENQKQRRYLERIRRLCTLMVRLEEAKDPVAWYRENYSELSERTRQRDFQELAKAGYRIQYNPLHDPDRNWDSNYVPGWICDFPTGAYDITV